MSEYVEENGALVDTPEDLVEEADVVEEVVEEENHDSVGAPVPTNELNPNNPSNDDSKPAEVLNDEPDINIGDIFANDFSAYEPLFRTYIEAIDQQGKNIEYLKGLIENIGNAVNECQNKIWRTRAFCVLLTIGFVLSLIFR